jgi:hypothetical protein
MIGDGAIEGLQILRGDLFFYHVCRFARRTGTVALTYLLSVRDFNSPLCRGAALVFRHHGAVKVLEDVLSLGSGLELETGPRFEPFTYIAVFT